MRVLHVSPFGGDAWAYGGIPRVVEALTDGLATRGHQVTVCTTDVADQFARLAAPGRRWSSWSCQRPSGALVHVFPNVSNRLAYHQQLFLPMGLRRFLRRAASDYDVAHVHACRNFPGTIAASALLEAGIPYVLAPNGTAPNIERRYVAKHVFDLLWGRRVLRGAARVLAVTHAERLQLRALGVRDEKIRQVPNPVHLAVGPVAVRGAFRRRMGIGSEPLVLYLGKLTPRKRVDVLVRALGTLPDRTARLVIAGNDMGTRADLEALARTTGLSERITFAGLVPGNARLSALADADVVVYPSEHEIFGLVPCEALSMGTPVIVCNDSGCGEILGGLPGVLAVPVGDVPALTGAMSMILGRRNEWRLQTAGAVDSIRSRFSVPTVCAGLESVYAEIA
jgi:glycosyltransferase involved in cell wall biosynthesis